HPTIERSPSADRARCPAPVRASLRDLPARVETSIARPSVPRGADRSARSRASVLRGGPGAACASRARVPRMTRSPFRRTGTRRPARLHPATKVALRREHGLDRLHEPTLRDRPDDLLPHRTTLEDDEVRDAAHTVADGGAGVVVDVHLDDLQLPRVLARELLDD